MREACVEDEAYFYVGLSYGLFHVFDRYNKYVKKAIIEKLGPAEQDQGDEETTPQLPLIIRSMYQ